jgi:hypothetical protein
VYPVFFIPILASSYYLLRRIAALLRWRPPAVITLCLSFVLLQTVAQLYYEPSENGAPSMDIYPLWLASVGAAVAWAFVRSIRTGLLRRTCRSFINVGRKPAVWCTTIIILLAIGIPITLHAKQIRNPRQAMAITWLNELETKLTDAFVEEIKRDHTSNKATTDSAIPISSAAHALLTDERIKRGNSLRIYVPVNETDYIFLWGNDRFQYCDIRRLAREHTVQMDQEFIDALIASDGTHQTRLYSVLWSPYMAGRVLKDRVGKVKAICVINAP